MIQGEAAVVTVRGAGDQSDTAGATGLVGRAELISVVAGNVGDGASLAEVPGSGIRGLSQVVTVAGPTHGDPMFAFLGNVSQYVSPFTSIGYLATSVAGTAAIVSTSSYLYWTTVGYNGGTWLRAAYGKAEYADDPTGAWTSYTPSWGGYTPLKLAAFNDTWVMAHQPLVSRRTSMTLRAGTSASAAGPWTNFIIGTAPTTTTWGTPGIIYADTVGGLLADAGEYVFYASSPSGSWTMGHPVTILGATYSVTGNTDITGQMEYGFDGTYWAGAVSLQSTTSAALQTWVFSASSPTSTWTATRVQAFNGSGSQDATVSAYKYGFGFGAGQWAILQANQGYNRWDVLTATNPSGPWTLRSSFSTSSYPYLQNLLYRDGHWAIQSWRRTSGQLTTIEYLHTTDITSGSWTTVSVVSAGSLLSSARLSPLDQTTGYAPG